jgi:hypothetical protein
VLVPAQGKKILDLLVYPGRSGGRRRAEDDERARRLQRLPDRLAEIAGRRQFVDVAKGRAQRMIAVADRLAAVLDRETEGFEPAMQP